MVDCMLCVFYHNKMLPIRKEIDKPQTWKKIFVRHISDKQLVSEYINNSYKSIIKKLKPNLRNRQNTSTLDTSQMKFYKW